MGSNAKELVLGIGLWYTTDARFDIVSPIEAIEVIAVGVNIHDLAYLQKVHGLGRWRKLKGVAQVRLPNGRIRRVELHWYEAHGVGRKDVKIKCYLD
jgi:hypothetical protein